jgi:hypothetical protein
MQKYKIMDELNFMCFCLAEYVDACGGLEHQEAEDYLLELEA